MDFCTGCGYERNGAANYCTVCGTEFGEPVRREDPWYEDTWRATSSASTRTDVGVGLLDDLLVGPGPEPRGGGWDRPPQGGAPGPRHRSPSRLNWIAMVTVAVVIIAGLGGAAAFELLHGHARASTQAARHGRTPASSSSAHGGRSTPHPSAAPSVGPSASAGSGRGGTRVAVAPAVAGNPALPRVLEFLDRYFTAINTHDYQAYAGLLDQQVLEQSSAAKFYSGDGSTTDSDATLVGISETNSGVVAAAITFTSRQQPAESPDQSACDNWSITVYLVPDGSGYLLGLPPPGYQASYTSC
jgi:hypothetical protein